MQITTGRSYRATLIPKDIAADEAELKSSQGVLPTIQMRVGNAGRAEQLAHYLTGLPVLKVECVEESA